MNFPLSSPKSLAFWKSLVGISLIALLAIFILGHIWTVGTIWNHVSGAHFSPWKNYVSDYAYRSPVWGMFVGCMYGLAALLGGLSLVIALSDTRSRVLAWLCCSLLAYSALKLCEVAIFPVKPPEITAEQIQSRLDKPAWNQLTDELYSVGLRFATGKVVRPTSVQHAIKGFESNANHLLGITPAMVMIFASMLLCPFLNPSKWKSPLRIGMLCLSLLLTICASPALNFFGEKVGLAQRVGFVGVYLWLWLNWLILFGTREPSAAQVRSLKVVMEDA